MVGYSSTRWIRIYIVCPEKNIFWCQKLEKTVKTQGSEKPTFLEKSAYSSFIKFSIALKDFFLNLRDKLILNVVADHPALVRIFGKMSFMSTAQKSTFVHEKGIKSFLNRDGAFISTLLDSLHRADKSYAFVFFNSLYLWRYDIFFHNISNRFANSWDQKNISIQCWFFRLFID
jgi:hypothetical protein